MKKKYVREIVSPSRRGMSFGKWKDRVEEFMYMIKINITSGEEFEQAKKECLNREKWKLFCDNLFGGTFPEGVRCHSCT